MGAEGRQTTAQPLGSSVEMMRGGQSLVLVKGWAGGVPARGSWGGRELRTTPSLGPWPWGGWRCWPLGWERGWAVVTVRRQTASAEKSVLDT